MQQYNIFQAIYMSFYSRKLYRDVAANWGGKTFLYLILMIVLTSIYFTFMAQHNLTEGYQLIYTSVIEPQVPVITIDNGKVVTPEKKPYFITDPKSHSNFAVIDTTGQYTSLEQANAMVLVTQTEVITQTKKDETKIYKIPDDANATLDPAKLNEAVQGFIGFLWLPIFLFTVLLAYLYRIIQALIYGIVGKLFALMFSVKLGYWQIVQIMMVAITPVLVIGAVLEGLNVPFGHPLLLSFLLAMAYLFYGIIANKN